MKVRVLHITNSVSPQSGGVAEAIRLITNGLVEDSGIECVESEILTFDNELYPETTEKFISKISNIGTDIRIWGFSCKLNSWFDENISRFNIIVIHGIWLYHSYGAFKYWIKYLRDTSNVKLFVMPHGMLDPWFQTEPKRKYKAIRNEIYWRFIENNVINKSDGILFTCEREKELAKLTFKNYNPTKEYVLGLGVKKAAFNILSKEELFKSLSIDFNGKYFLFLGRIDFKKGVDILIKAYNKFLTDQSLLDVFPKLIIAGPGLDTPYGKEVLNIVASNDILKANVFFTGMLSGDLKWNIIQHSEAFVLSSYQENFGIAVVEALSCGVPVIISNQVNIYTEILTGNAGLVTENSIEKISESLQTLSSKGETDLMNYKSNALKCFNKYYDVSVVSKAYKNFFLDLY
ncbi:glycosyltransferase [Flectobacillus roseus]|uniref:glycosyltransferase n=1 Tax=Flectobacillus roseus TaxID=502259 RepID=UPI0024B7ED0F|nr:glycosyltransferase [Flectobacillus roseus]MDI9872480.1 glycosyltransferase [Flectobacillus roseus]